MWSLSIVFNASKKELSLVSNLYLFVPPYHLSTPIWMKSVKTVPLTMALIYMIARVTYLLST